MLTFVNVIGIIIVAVGGCTLGFLLTVLIDDWKNKKN